MRACPIQREGWRDHHERVCRLYRDQGLLLRLKRPKRNKAAKSRHPLQRATHPNHIWGMHFVTDALFDGRGLRLLTIIDLVSSGCPSIVVGQSLKGRDV